jgi:hypothetical protein
VAKKPGAAEPNQTIWPHLVVGFVAGAVAVRLLGGEPSALVVPGLVGAGLGYLLHCWQHPLAKCWWPSRGVTGWLLGLFGLRGCGDRTVTSGKYYSIKRRCPVASAEPGVCAGRGAGVADPPEATEARLDTPWHCLAQ